MRKQQKKFFVLGVSVCVLSMVQCVFAQDDVTAQNFVAAQEAYNQNVVHYHGAYSAMLRAPSQQTVGRYVEQATVVLQKKSTTLAAWAASRHVAQDYDRAQTLFLADIDDVLAQSITARRAVDDAADHATLEESLHAVQAVHAAYASVQRKTMVRVWRERIVLMMADLDDLVDSIRTRDFVQKDEFIARIAAQRSVLENLRAQVAAVPLDANADPENAQFEAVIQALRDAQAPDSTWDEMRALTSDLSIALTS